MMKALLVATLLYAPIAFAEEFARTNFSSSVSLNHNGIVGIAAISSTRPAFPETQDSVRVYVEPDAWGVSSCRPDAFDIPRAEDHMIELLHSSDLRVVVVDDALPRLGDVCQAVVVRSTPNQGINFRDDRRTPP